MDASQRQSTAQAFEAYNAMETTRQRHFDYLNMLTEREKRFNLQRSELESEFLANLLADHDQQVKRFKAASDVLRGRSEDDFKAMFAWLGELDKKLDPIRQSEQQQ